MSPKKQTVFQQNVDLYPVVDGMSHLEQITLSGGLRAYRKPGTRDPLWSVTSILSNTISKGYGLLYWYNSQGRKAVGEVLSESVGKILTQDHLDFAIKEAGKRPEKSRDEAASLGSRAHDLIADHVRSRIDNRSDSPLDGPVPEDLQIIIDSYKAWEEEAQVEGYLSAETAVFSSIFQYAGTIDALAWTRETADRPGRFLVLDWKTSKQIYNEMALQLASYVSALVYGLRMQYGLPESWDAFNHIEPWIIRLGKGPKPEFEARRVKNTLLAFEGFISALHAWHALGMPGLTVTGRKTLNEYFDIPEDMPSVWEDDHGV